MESSPVGPNRGFITPSRASPADGKFIVDPPLSTKREKVYHSSL
jgi:hypothetical protein